jgi:flagellar protein FlgJ
MRLEGNIGMPAKHGLALQGRESPTPNPLPHLQTKVTDGATDPKALKDLKKACEQFEAVFAKQLFSEMRKGIKETQIGDQTGSEIYKDMMDQSVADAVAHRGALGIGNLLYKQFAKQVVAGASPVPTNPISTDNENSK